MGHIHHARPCSCAVHATYKQGRLWLPSQAGRLPGTTVPATSHSHRLHRHIGAAPNTTCHGVGQAHGGFRLYFANCCAFLHLRPTCATACPRCHCPGQPGSLCMERMCADAGWRRLTCGMGRVILYGLIAGFSVYQGVLCHVRRAWAYCLEMVMWMQRDSRSRLRHGDAVPPPPSLDSRQRAPLES